MNKKYRKFQKLKVMQIISRKSFLQHVTTHKCNNFFRMTETENYFFIYKNRKQYQTF